MSTSPKPSAWEKAKHNSKTTFDRAWAGFEKLGAPVNKLTNKIGSEAFWPTTLDHESDKAARILKSFCKDGFYTEQPAPSRSSPGPKNKPRVLVKIPQKVIQNCVGLAIFTVMRTGLWVSGAGGSGVLIARKEDGSWSPPSGLLVHTLGVGFMAGIDIYDCVIVINDRKALNAFSKLRVSLGGELSVVAGPVGAGGILESEVMKDRKPVWSYMKSRGLYGGLQFDGTIIIERNDENARFYGERIPIGDILAGRVKRVPPETRMLMEVVKQAEGRTDVDPGILHQVDQMPPPSDIEVEKMSGPTPQQMNAYGPPSNYGYGHSQVQAPYFAPPLGSPAQGYSGYRPGEGQAPNYPPPSGGSNQNYSGYHPGEGQAPNYPPPSGSSAQGHSGYHPDEGQAPDYPPPPGSSDQGYSGYHPGDTKAQAPDYPPPPGSSTQNNPTYHPNEAQPPAYPPQPSSQGESGLPPNYIPSPPSGPPPPRDEKHPGGPDYRYS